MNHSEALLCRSCYQKGKESDCHLTITCQENEMCYTQVDKYDNFGKRYTKNCMNKQTCVALQDLNDKRYCSWLPSSCLYCCDDGNVV
ncbi:hypothetical protein LSH36_416g02068 [Paralvinella palmiformis]|uniref:Uncharacterized protein n=1 Tax=Paralvinella palmiformis TaxID=53620 RepID=A0AAD9MZU4_9ANNE|nr:hypothetical protein LSH36_416g02068 [Paralvinella palmiformis]